MAEFGRSEEAAACIDIAGRFCALGFAGEANFWLRMHTGCLLDAGGSADTRGNTGNDGG